MPSSTITGKYHATYQYHLCSKQSLLLLSILVQDETGYWQCVKTVYYILIWIYISPDHAADQD